MLLDTITRVCYDDDNNTIEVSKTVNNRIELTQSTVYGKYEELPEWIQGRLALLMLLSGESAGEVEGIGCSLGNGLFWLYEEVGC